MKTYTTTDAEAQRLRERSQTLIVVPMKQQPERVNGVLGKGGELRFPWATFYDNGIVHTWDRNGVGGENWNANDYPKEDKFAAALKLTPYKNPYPYAPGDIIGIKEAWARCLCKQPNCPGFLYRDHLGWNTRDSGKHFGAANMPRKAIRTRLLCRTVEGKLVSEAAPKQMLAAGLEALGWDYAEGGDSEDDGAMFAYWDHAQGDPPEWASWASSCECIYDVWRSYWKFRHPRLPFETTWVWMIVVELQK